MEDPGTSIHDLLRLSADGIVVVDAEGLVRFGNPAAEVLLGLGPGEAVGFHLGYPVADRGSSSLVLNRADGQSSIVEMRVAETNWDGEPAFAINLRDITERTRLDRERRSAQERARRYFDAAGVLFVALDRAGTVVDVNSRGSRILAAARSEILGRDWVETFVPEDEREATRASFRRLSAGETDSLLPVEGRVLRPDGGSRFISWHNTILRDDEGAISSGILLSGEDITERHAAEVLSTRYRDIVEKMPVGVHVYHLENREDDRTLRMIAVNPAAERFTGVTRSETTSMSGRAGCTPRTSPRK